MPRLINRRAAACLATAFVAVLAADALGWDKPTPSEILNGDDVCELIELLENETFRDQRYLELRQSALIQLREIVRGAGEELAYVAVEQVRTGDRDARKRAQFVLAQMEETPEAPVRTLLEHPDPEVWIWAHVSSRRGLGVRDGEYARAPTELDADVAALTAPGEEAPDDEPLIAVRDALQERILAYAQWTKWWPDGDGNEESEAYRAHMEETAAQPWLYIPGDRRRFVDLDGDGIDEVVVAALRLWPGESATPDRCGDMSFVAVIARDAEGEWELAAYRRADNQHMFSGLIVADLDGDGRDECLLRSRIVAGWCWGQLRPVTRAGVGEGITSSFPDQRVSIVRRPGTDEFFFLTSEGYKTTHSGKAAYLCGTIAYEYQIHAVRDGALQHVGAVYVR